MRDKIEGITLILGLIMLGMTIYSELSLATEELTPKVSIEQERKNIAVDPEENLFKDAEDFLLLRGQGKPKNLKELPPSQEALEEIKENYKIGFKKLKEIIERYPDSEYVLRAFRKIGGHGETICTPCCSYTGNSLAEESDLLNLIGIPEEETPFTLMLQAEVKWAMAGKLKHYEQYEKSEEKLKEALQIYFRILEKYPESKLVDEAQFSIGNCYIHIKEYANTIERLQEVLKKYSPVEAFQKVIEKYPQSNSAPYAMLAIADYYQSKLKEYESIKEYRGSYSVTSIVALVEAYQVDLKDSNEIIKEYQKVIKTYPDSRVAPQAQDSIGDIYYCHLKDYPQAIIEYQKIIDNYPNYYDIDTYKRTIERCYLLLEFQKRGVDANWLQYENLDTLRLFLEIHKRGIKEEELFDLRCKSVEELQKLLEEEGDISKILVDTSIKKFSSPEYAVESLYLRTENLIEEGKNEELLRVCKEIIEKYPESDYVPSVIDRIEMSYNNIMLELGREELKKDPVLYLLIKAIIKRGYLYWTCASETEVYENEDEILGDYYEILNKYPDSKFADEVQWNIGSYYYLRDDYTRAIREFQKVIDKYPNTNSAPVARYWIGVCYDEGFQDYQRAVEEWRRVVTEYPTYRFSVALAQECIAATYRINFNDYHQAIKEYQKVLNNAPWYYDPSDIAWEVERCQVLLEFQKRGIDTERLEDEHPHKFPMLLELHKKGEDIFQYLNRPIEELHRLLKEKQ
ncbi:MAG: tetratricopeptide repeat protein [bacterium]